MEQRRRLHLVAFSQGHLAEGDIDTLQEHFIGRGEPSHAQSEGLCSCIAVAKPNRHHGAGYFQLEMASERDRESAYELVGKYLRDDANGLPQMAYIGCIVTQSPRAETAQEVCDQLVAAAKYIDKQRIGSTDDCGFSPFSIDTKPNHGSPDYARDIAFQKITNRVAGTKMAAEKLGVH